jgi:hypothetical protein
MVELGTLLVVQATTHRGLRGTRIVITTADGAKPLKPISLKEHELKK